MFEIDWVHAREILDSRGNPTVEVEVETEWGFGRAAVPSGASTGANEALELRDGSERYDGKGVEQAVENVNTEIRGEVVGFDVRAQRNIDLAMINLDGTENKSRLGANAILGVSMATAKCAANTLGLPLYQYLGGSNSYRLPVPTMNIINGGEHAGNDLSIQEFMVQPWGAPDYREAVRWCAEVYHELGRILEEEYGAGATNIGDEGGYAPPMEMTRDALDAITRAIDEAGYTEDEIQLGLDPAASEFYENDKYYIDGQRFDAAELIDYYAELVESYPIRMIEDPFDEEAFEDFALITERLGDTIIVGDDLFVTNPRILQKGIRMGAANALLLKLNQIGTVSEAFDAATMAYRAGYKVVVSHRSAETPDSTIADVSVALGAELIKTGAPARGERTSKYNQLLRIEEELGGAAEYTGNLSL